MRIAELVTFSRSVDPGSYAPGGTLDVTLTVDIRLDTPETSFSITETLPFGWSLHSIVSGPASLPVQPVACDSVFTFAWEAESYPATLVYRVNVPGFATGDVLLEGAISLTLEGLGTFAIEEETLVSEGAPGTGNNCPYFKLTATCTGGHIAIDPIHHHDGVHPWIRAGTEVTVEAVPGDASHDFDGWSGFLSGVANPTVFTIFDELSIHAVFSAPGHYIPGCTLPLDITLTNQETEAITALGLALALPPGWTLIDPVPVIVGAGEGEGEGEGEGRGRRRR